MLVNLRLTNDANGPRKRASLTHPGLQYTAFLFEPLGDDGHGVPLALASILGRMSLDPWSEAASLAAMPAAVAALKVASLIESTPNQGSMRPEYNKLAERLIGLLPARSMPADAAAAPCAASHAAMGDAAMGHAAMGHAAGGRSRVMYLGWIVLVCVLLVAENLG
jgi:hypothetical protein